MSEVQCPECGGHAITIQRLRGWGYLALLSSLLLFAMGYIKLQTWFPSDTFWQDFIMSGAISIPDHYTGWNTMKYFVSFAVLCGSGVFLAGFGLQLLNTSVLTCRNCGYEEREGDSSGRINRGRGD